jgi:hypothetical protein
MPNVSIGRSAQAVATTPEPPKQQPQGQAQIEVSAKQADDRALTPVYPAAPGIPKGQAETVGGVSQEQGALAPQSDPRTAAHGADYATRGEDSYAMEPAARQDSNADDPTFTGGGSAGYNQNLDNH